MAEIKRDEATKLFKKLRDCRIHLQNDNVYSCLAGFWSILEMHRRTPMLPADEKELRKEINTFQSDLAASRAFFHLYGPVTFKDDDLETTLDFVKQLVQIKDDEMAEALEQQKQEVAAKVSGDLQERVRGIMEFVEKGEFSTAREEAAGDEEAADALIEVYNELGIQYRKEKQYDKAVAAFKKAIFIRPEDEGLYYNMARAYIETANWKSAKETMEEILQVQPEFSEGRRLLQLIKKNLT